MLSIGDNFYTSKKGQQSIHAEMCAMNKLRIKKDNKKINILVIRITHDGELRQSRPCKHCIMSLSQYRNVRIKNIYYSDQNGDIIKEKFKDMIDGDNFHISKGNRK